jgi:signal transduction histidine kinase
MGRSLFKKSIRRRLAVHILLAGFLPLALGLGLTYHYGIQALRNSIGASFAEIATETGKQLDDLISDEIRKLRTLATLPAVVDEVSQANRSYLGLSEELIWQRLLKRDHEWIQFSQASREHDILNTELSRYLKRILELDDRRVMGTLITDRYGGLVSASSTPKRYYFGEEDWWQQTVQQANAYISGVMPSGRGSFSSSEETIDIAIPLWDSAGQTILGVMKICYGFNNLFAPISEVRIGDTGHAMLFDSGGTPLICPILPRDQHLVTPLLLGSIQSSTPGWLIAPDDAHGAYNTIVGYAPVPMMNRLGGPNLGGKSWHIFIRQHPAESYAPAYAMLGKVAILGGILIGMLALSGLYVGSRITKPIRELQKGAKLIGEGQLDHRLAIQTRDEVEELAGEFNRMAGRIKASQEERARWHRELELKVEERTAELRRSEEMRREAYAQMMHAEKLASLGRMAAGVAHEIGNPLSSISAIIQVLERGKVTEEKRSSYLHSLKQLVNRIDRTLRGLLAFSRPTPPKLEALDIHQVIEEAIRITEPDPRFRKIVIDRKPAQVLHDIQGDPDQLVQVFVNLLLNAADAVSENGKITIETGIGPGTDEVTIIFSDNGHGIPREALSRIFDPFYTTKGPGKGTGLGLSICRGIIEGLGGQIRVESTEGKGTTFTITLPRQNLLSKEQVLVSAGYHDE